MFDFVVLNNLIYNIIPIIIIHLSFLVSWYTARFRFMRVTQLLSIA